MKTDTRHATPTTAIMLRRIDRKLNELRDSESVAAMNKILAHTIQSLEQDNKALRRYLGSVLFERRVKEANPLMAEPPPKPPNPNLDTSVRNGCIYHYDRSWPIGFLTMEHGLEVRCEDCPSNIGSLIRGYQAQERRERDPIPTLKDVVVPTDHVYVGARCGRCHCTKEAIEASNLPCEP